MTREQVNARDMGLVGVIEAHALLEMLRSHVEDRRDTFGSAVGDALSGVQTILEHAQKHLEAVVN